MSRIYKVSMTDLNGTVSFGGGGCGGGGGGCRGGGGGGGNRRGRARQNNAASRRSRGSYDFNGNGSIADEVSAAATIASGLVTMALPAPGARVVGGLTAAGAIAGYINDSRGP